jgi:hypothetical protein
MRVKKKKYQKKSFFFIFSQAKRWVRTHIGYVVFQKLPLGRELQTLSKEFVYEKQ